MTVAEFFDRWLTKYAAQRVRSSTCQTYVWAGKKIREILGNVPLSRLCLLHDQRFISELAKSELSGTSIRYHCAVLKKVLGHAVKWQLIPRNPADAVDPPAKNRFEPQVLSPEEVGVLLEGCSEGFGRTKLGLWVLT
ncbi:MAG: hypothetical protein PWQ91_1818 [Eubacteriales bacterium]|nr:hypothetical protein [Eubacteriales bacterium]